MFAFWLSSQRNWEVKCPSLLLAETGSLRRDLLPSHWLSIKERRSAVAFRWCAPDLTGPLQNGEDRTQYGSRRIGFLPLQTYKPCWSICKSSDTKCYKRDVLQRGYEQGFVLVLCQDRVVGFQTVSAKKKKKKRRVKKKALVPSQETWTKTNLQFYFREKFNSQVGTHNNVNNTAEKDVAATRVVTSYGNCVLCNHSAIISTRED